MLFNSYTFIFLFFPVVLFVYFRLGESKRSDWANVWLVLASLFFYGYWEISFLPLLVGSILINYWISGGILSGKESGNVRRQKIFFGLGLAFNIGLLVWYKYMDFFIANLNRFGTHIPLLHLVLPLGISFFTITQVLYLLDCYAGVAKDHDFVHYALFVSFFPHLLSGPILYHKQMMTQFRDETLRRPDWENLARGLSLFIIGLAKKVLIADSFIPFVKAGFDKPESLAMLPAWLTAIAYLMQLYFDFSGYSDMAVGLARMMNIEIPINFNAPYRATSLIAFWQRWHMSLTNAITACVYMPVLRSFKKMTFGAMVFSSFVAFFVVGIWHGAGWKYVAFALLHSGGIVVNHLWRHYHWWMPKMLGRILTLLLVLAGMVLFRADNLHMAGKMFMAMIGGYGIGMSLPVTKGVQMLAISGFRIPLMLILAVGFVIYCPTSNELVKREPAYGAMLVLAAAFSYAVINLSSISEFLYFQF